MTGQWADPELRAGEPDEHTLERLRREAVAITADLIRVDSTNTGHPTSIGTGESICARIIQERLAEIGLHGDWYERTPGRGNVVFRIPGSEPQLPALLIHAHTDTVPADPDDWTVNPWGGEIRDGELWGRGAVDMKNMIGMTLAALRALHSDGWQPRRDIVLAFVADEEVASVDGMGFLVDHHPEIFSGVTEAVGELGGFSIETPRGRAYAVGIGEKAVAWATLRATGTEGHGSLVPNTENAVARIAAAVARITEHEWPLADDPAARTVLQHLSDTLGVVVTAENVAAHANQLGPIGPMLSAAFQTSAALTQVHAGSKTNTVPGTAIATVDCRIAPGYEEEFHRVFARLVGPGIAVEWDEAAGATAPYETALTDAIAHAVQRVDPGAQTIPFVTGGATDAKALGRLGIACYGFVPLRLPQTFDFPGRFHGIDERVPLSALESGAEILREFLRLQ